jgi:IS5 family transposase
MLRVRKDQPSLWESVLPEEMLALSEELTKVDALLDDERFFAPFREKFGTHLGRPTVPVATYLRMMYLKRRYNLGYESLVKEVRDSFSWRRFCQLALNDSVPDASTLIKLTHKYGEEAIQALNDALVLKLKEGKLVRGRKLRLDTYVVEANIHHPTDTSLLADGIRVITRTVARLRKAGVEIGNGFVSHTRKVKKICLEVSKLFKGRASKSRARLTKAQKQLIKIAKKAIAGGRKVKAQIEESGERQPPVISRLAERLDGWLGVSEKIVEQTEQVVRGHLRIPRRVVSIFDTGARPIRRGKARVDTEFGRKVLIGETDHGIITTHEVLEDNPADATLLKAGVRRHRRLFRKRLKAVATDRGFYSQANELWLKEGGVERVSIPVRGRASRERRLEQKQPWFRRLQRFRAGSEGRISLLKRVFGLDRSLMRGNQGTAIWVGQGIFAHNLWQAARIM